MCVGQLGVLATERQYAHWVRMTKRATERPAGFVKPAHWNNDPPPAPRKVEQHEALSPTRYGDWESKGIAIDF